MVKIHLMLINVEHRQGHSLGKKSDEHLQCSLRSWLDDFTQPFSWRSSLSQALVFLNKLFLPGVAWYPKIGFQVPVRSITNNNYISSSFNQRIFVIVIPRVALGVRGNDGLLARLPTSYSREATRL